MFGNVLGMFSNLFDIGNVPNSSENIKKNPFLLWEFQYFSVTFPTGFFRVLFKITFPNCSDHINKTFHKNHKKALVTFRQRSKNVKKKKKTFRSQNVKKH